MPNISFIYRYKWYVKFSKLATNQSELKKPFKDRTFLRTASPEPTTNYGRDTYEKVTAPKVSQKSVATYEKYIRTQFDVCNGPTYKTYNIFSKYVIDNASAFEKE